MPSRLRRACTLLGLTAALLPPFIRAAELHPAAFLADPAPNTLSQYGLFADAVGQIANVGLVPYSLISQLHSDYSEKFRFVYIPAGQSVAYRPEGLLQMPVGSALIKTFAYPASNSPDAPLRLLETRMLVHLPSGWQARVYVWNRQQTEAHYRVAGKTIMVDWLDVGGQTGALRYRVPNLNQCTTCHSAEKALVPIGPRARNLDRAFQYARFGGHFDQLGTSRNQLSAWAQLGMLSGLPGRGEHGRVVDWADTDADLNARARAYLDINCGHCHSPAGTANTSGLYLNWEEARGVRIGIGKRPVAAGRGSGGRSHDLLPGRPDESILLFRMQSDKPGVRMPEISLTRPHKEGIALIRDWILSLE